MDGAVIVAKAAGKLKRAERQRNGGCRYMRIDAGRMRQERRPHVRLYDCAQRQHAIDKSGVADDAKGKGIEQYLTGPVHSA